MNALADEKVGDYLNRHFASAAQKVGTFRIVGDLKLGGNVASYFCRVVGDDLHVVHCVPGPVDVPFLHLVRVRFPGQQPPALGDIGGQVGRVGDVLKRPGEEFALGVADDRAQRPVDP